MVGRNYEGKVISAKIDLGNSVQGAPVILQLSNIISKPAWLTYVSFEYQMNAGESGRPCLWIFRSNDYHVTDDFVTAAYVSIDASPSNSAGLANKAILSSREVTNINGGIANFTTYHVNSGRLPDLVVFPDWYLFLAIPDNTGSSDFCTASEIKAIIEIEAIEIASHEIQRKEIFLQ